MIKSIYYVALKYDYGDFSKGFSYEHDNMEADIGRFCQKNNILFHVFNPDSLNDMDRLRSIEKADMIFHVAFNDSLDLPLDIAMSYKNAGKIVAQWDCDSSYRFNNWIWPRRDRVTHFITTHKESIPWYNTNNMKVILSQWAMSASHYYIPNSEKRYDVSFIGQKHGIRQAIMDVLWANDLKVHKWGDFWVNDPFYHGRLREVGDVVGVMNCSKINLNLQNPWAISTSSQIKGRIMQIPACRAFQLCTPAPCVEDYFIPDKEIVIANDMNELVDKARYYLTHDKEREEIAEAGYQRCLREHTWENRMSKILGELNG